MRNWNWWYKHRGAIWTVLLLLILLVGLAAEIYKKGSGAQVVILPLIMQLLVMFHAELHPPK